MNNQEDGQDKRMAEMLHQDQVRAGLDVILRAITPAGVDLTDEMAE
ncbi:MAG: hypothetical protein UX04_C0002G0052 [Microgenomates group bacterium GW2011_GWF2_45_18]|nr:MAG: hypothetical protein UW18_C0001G0045 [Microgenomates group bacterium GW2011_GWF1_44_10]KKU01909.1 MAG: hypothetical protein UX04_C0002G0052 [Microgenomates group bacterium GW2011_GWF2_45_18]